MVDRDPESRVPKYIRIKEDIIRSIREGDLKPGDQVMSRSQFVQAYGVSDITVRKAIDELTGEGYLYRMHGKGTFVARKSQEPLTIALLMPHLHMPHLHMPQDTEQSVGYNTAPPVIQAINDEAKKHDANILLYLANDSIEAEREILANILRRKVDAAIIWFSGGAENLRHLTDLQDSGMPVVLLDRHLRGIEIDYVTTAHRQGAYDAVRHLLNRGFSNIHHLTGGEPLSSVQDRTEGCIQAVSERGLQPFVHHVPYSIRTNVESWTYSVTSEVMGKVERPFALFASNAVLLEWTWRVIRENNLPRDSFALACFDEPYTRLPEDVCFVRVIQPLEEIGRRAVQIAMSRLAGDRTPHQEEIPPRIVVTDSK